MRLRSMLVCNLSARFRMSEFHVNRWFGFYYVFVVWSISASVTFRSCINFFGCRKPANFDFRKAWENEKVNGTGENDDSILIVLNCSAKPAVAKHRLMSHNFQKPITCGWETAEFPMKTAFHQSVLPTVEPCFHPSRTDREGIINGRRCYGRHRAAKKVVKRRNCLGKQDQARALKRN